MMKDGIGPRCLRIMCAAIALSMAAVGACLSSLALAQEADDNYVVMQVKGTVLTREPLAPHWIPVEKGMLLKRGQLIQTTQGSSVSLEAQSNLADGEASSGNQKKESKQSKLRRKSILKIATPMIVRIQPNLYRKVKVSRYFLEDVPAMASLHRPKTGPIVALQNAWNKVSLEVKGGSSKKSSLLKLSSDGEDDVDLKTNGQKIALLSPPADALMRAAKLPLELQIAWRRPDANIRSFVIYLWKIDGERPPPVAHTKLDWDMILVPSLGEYFVQVASEDGAWQTEPHMLRVVSMDTKSGASSTSGNLSQTGSIRALYPPPSLTLFTSRGTTGVAGENEGSGLLFQWRLDGPVDVRQFELVIVDTNGKEVSRSQVKDARIHQKLSPGDYYWWVEANAASRMGSVQESTSLGIGSQRPTGASLIRSESRQLTIIKGFDSIERAGWLKARLKGEQRGAIYLPDGL